MDNNKVFEIKSYKASILDKIKLLFTKTNKMYGEYGIVIYYKRLNNKIYITKEVIPQESIIF